MAPQRPRRSTRTRASTVAAPPTTTRPQRSPPPPPQTPPSRSPAPPPSKPFPPPLPIPSTSARRPSRASPYPLTLTSKPLLQVPDLDVSTPFIDPDFPSPKSPNSSNLSSAPTTATSASFSNGELTDEEDQDASPVRLVRGKRKRRGRWEWGRDWRGGEEIDGLGWWEEEESEEEGDGEGDGDGDWEDGEEEDGEWGVGLRGGGGEEEEGEEFGDVEDGEDGEDVKEEGEEEEEEGEEEEEAEKEKRPRKKRKISPATPKAAATAKGKRKGKGKGKRKENPKPKATAPTPRTPQSALKSNNTLTPNTPEQKTGTVTESGSGRPHGRPLRAKSVTFDDPLDDDGIRETAGDVAGDGDQDGNAMPMPMPTPTPAATPSTRGKGKGRTKRSATAPPAAAHLHLAPRLTPPKTPATPLTPTSTPTRRSSRLLRSTKAAPSALSSSSAPALTSAPSGSSSFSSAHYAAADEKELEQDRDLGDEDEEVEDAGEEGEEQGLDASPTPRGKGEKTRSPKRGVADSGSGKGSENGSRSELFPTPTQEDAGVEADEESAALPPTTANKAATSSRRKSPKTQARRKTPSPKGQVPDHWSLDSPLRQEWRRTLSVDSDEERRWTNSRGEWVMNGALPAGEEVGVPVWIASTRGSGGRGRRSLSRVNEPVTGRVEGTAVRGYSWGEDGDEVVAEAEEEEEQEEETQGLPTPPPSGGKATLKRKAKASRATLHQTDQPQNTETAAGTSPRSSPTSRKGRPQTKAIPASHGSPPPPHSPPEHPPTHTPSTTPPPPSRLSALFPPKPVSPKQAISLLTHLNDLIYRFVLLNFTSPSPSFSPLGPQNIFPPSLSSALLSSKQLISSVHSFADGSQYGWPSLFTTPDMSSILVEGIISRLLYEQVFKKTCFGASAEEAEWLDREEAIAEAWREGFLKRGIKRAKRVMVLREKTSTSLPGAFNSEVEKLVEELAKMLKPMLPSSRDAKERGKNGENAEKQDLREDLEGIVAFAALLSISFRFSPLHPDPALCGGQYEITLARPGTEFNAGLMTCVNPEYVEGTKHHGRVCGGYEMPSSTEASRIPASHRVKIAFGMGLTVDLPQHSIPFPSPPPRHRYAGIPKNRPIRTKTASHARNILIKPAVWVETTPPAFLYYHTSERHISNARLKRPWGRKITLSTAIAQDLEIQKLKRRLGNPFSPQNALRLARPLLPFAINAAAVGWFLYMGKPSVKTFVNRNLHRVASGARVLKKAPRVVWESKGYLPRRMGEKIEEVWRYLVEGIVELERQTDEALKEPLGERVMDVVKEDYGNVKRKVFG
ncbi:MAG: hypothetical protein Q9160_004960 [Pyrenula sp. 1 TL-2023]